MHIHMRAKKLACDIMNVPLTASPLHLSCSAQGRVEGFPGIPCQQRPVSLRVHSGTAAERRPWRARFEWLWGNSEHAQVSGSMYARLTGVCAETSESSASLRFMHIHPHKLSSHSDPLRHHTSHRERRPHLVPRNLVPYLVPRTYVLAAAASTMLPCSGRPPRRSSSASPMETWRPCASTCLAGTAWMWPMRR
jgi:hypothetical protein